LLHSTAASDARRIQPVADRHSIIDPPTTSRIEVYIGWRIHR
jgi:hypothetical protein